MVGVHELTVEESLWLTRMSRGRLLKDPIELGMPQDVRTALIAKSLAIAHGGLLEITPEGLAEALRRGDPSTQDAVVNRAPVLLVISPLGADGAPSGHGEGLDRQKRMSANLLRIAVDAAIIDQAASKLNTQPLPLPSVAALPDAEEESRRLDSDQA